MALAEGKKLKAQWQAEVELLEYTMKDVAAQNTKQDTWIVIHGQVFDITDYLQDHPGGAEVLIETAGTDATSAYEDVGHSEDAREIMQPYLVDTLKDAQQYVRPKSVRVVSQKAPEEIKSSMGMIGLAAGALGMALPALYIYSFGSGHLAHGLRTAFGLLPQPLRSLRFPRGSFVGGFLDATVVCGGIGGFVARQASQFTKINSGFQQYAPHINAKA